MSKDCFRTEQKTIVCSGKFQDVFVYPWCSKVPTILCVHWPEAVGLTVCFSFRWAPTRSHGVTEADTRLLY